MPALKAALSRALLVTAALSVTTPAVQAQQPDRPQTGIALFASPGDRLQEFRRLVRARVPAATLALEVRRLKRGMRQRQAGFVTRLRQLGGRVTAQWWLIPGCAFELPTGGFDALRAWPGLVALQADRIRRPTLSTATGARHHNSDAANLRRDARNRRITGQGLALGLLDSGIDSNYGSTQRPHACFFPGGKASNTTGPGLGGSRLLQATSVVSGSGADDSLGHGTGVASCALGAAWSSAPGVDSGIAPEAGVVSCNIANNLGLSRDSWIISGWQYLVSQRLSLDIAAANNSYSGSPHLDNALQLALDSAAYNADMLICVSAGNLGQNTSESQQAFNGLAIGAVDRAFLVRASFSAVGPLHNSRRSYPDLVAVGEQLAFAEHNQEGKLRIDSGTSYAAGLAAGSALLIRQARPELSANATRCLLLHSSRFRSSDRNSYGLGLVDTDRGVQLALADTVVEGRVSSSQPRARFDLQVQAGQSVVTLSWMRQEIRVGSTPPNLDLRVYDNQGQLRGQDANPQNSYEQLRLAGLQPGLYTAEVVWTNPGVGQQPIRFALAGEVSRSAPSLSGLSAPAVPTYRPDWLEIRGQNLSRVRQVLIDGQAQGQLEHVDDRRLRYLPPALLSIGNHQLRVVATGGSSGSLSLRYLGRATPLLVAPETVQRGNPPKLVNFEVHSDAGYLSLLLVSPDNQRSHLPGIMDLGIGANFSSLIPLVYLQHDARGRAVLPLQFPTSVPAALVYLQCLATDPRQPTTPYPASPVHRLRIL